MWVLSVIHSEIVATNPGPEQKTSQVQTTRSYKKRRKRVGISKRIKEKTTFIEEKESETIENIVVNNSSDSDSRKYVILQ